MSALITREPAVVFKAAGRRYFTRKAAINALARQTIRRRCECERADWLTNDAGFTCDLHRDRTRYAKIKRRLAGLIARRLATEAAP